MVLKVFSSRTDDPPIANAPMPHCGLTGSTHLQRRISRRQNTLSVAIFASQFTLAGAWKTRMKPFGSSKRYLRLRSIPSTHLHRNTSGAIDYQDCGEPCRSRKHPEVSLQRRLQSLLLAGRNLSMATEKQARIHEPIFDRSDSFMAASASSGCMQCRSIRT